MSELRRGTGPSASQAEGHIVTKAVHPAGNKRVCAVVASNTSFQSSTVLPSSTVLSFSTVLSLNTVHPSYSGLRILTAAIPLILLLVCPRPSIAQTDSSPVPDPERWAYGASILDDAALLDDGAEGLSALYNMEYGRADSIFIQIQNQFPGHPVGPFLRALLVWWQILPKLEMGATQDDDRFYDEMERVVEWADAILDRNAENFDAMLFKGAALGFRGRLKSNRGEWLSAALDGRETLDYIFKIAEADTTNADFQFGRGVYDYFASIIPKTYPQVKPLMFFFPKADRERGLKNLAFTAEEGHFIQTEAVYFLLQIHLFYEPNFVEARRRSDWLRSHYPRNAYFHVLSGRVHVRWSQWQRAISIFEEVVSRHDAGEVGYNDLLASQALYNIGRYEMGNGRYDRALSIFSRIEELSEAIGSDTHFNVNAALRTGMIYDAQGERDRAIAAYRAVIKMPDQGDSRDKARGFLKNPYQPN